MFSRLSGFCERGVSKSDLFMAAHVRLSQLMLYLCLMNSRYA